MGKEILTSSETNDTLRRLKDATGVKKDALALLSAVVSLKQSGARDFSAAVFDKVGGFRIHMQGVDPQQILATYIGALYGVDPASEGCIDLICSHVNEGARMLRSLLSKTDNAQRLFCDLESTYSSFTPQSAEDGGYRQGLPLLAGHIEGKQERPMFWSINDAQSNPHTAILGETRSGKTQFLLDLLWQIVEGSGDKSKFVFLAYKKDDGVDAFADALDAEILDPDLAPLPINPFILPEYSDREIAKSAQEKCDLVGEFDPNIRSVQKGFLRDGIIGAYKKRKGNSIPYPDFDEVRNEVLRQYAAKRDSLTELLDCFVNLSLFARSDGEIASRRFMGGGNTVIKLHGIPDKHRAIVASFVLESFVRECGTLRAAEIDPDSNTRSIRSCIVIDEAQNYLRNKNLFLEKLLRESAQNGFVVMLATQTPKSLCEKTDYLDFIRNFFVFRCPVSHTEASLLTGCRDNAKKQVADEIRNLSPGYCYVNRSNSPNISYCQIQASQFYKRQLR